MEKIPYLSPSCEIISFDTNEILAASGGVYSDGDGTHPIDWGGNADDPSIDPDARARNDFHWGNLWG